MNEGTSKEMRTRKVRFNEILQKQNDVLTCEYFVDSAKLLF